MALLLARIESLERKNAQLQSQIEAIADERIETLSLFTQETGSELDFTADEIHELSMSDDE